MVRFPGDNDKSIVMAKLGVSLGTKLDVRLGGVLLKMKI